MHTWIGDKVTISYNSDCSGDVRIRNQQTGQEIEVDGHELVEFVLDRLKATAIGRIESINLFNLLKPYL